MDGGRLLILAASCLASTLCSTAYAETQGQYLQMAEIEIDPAQADSYKAAVKEQIETAIRVQPGVLALYAVYEKDNLSLVRVFEIYADADAYKAHLETPHFRQYKATTQQMVRSLKLIQTVPIALGAKVK